MIFSKKKKLGRKKTFPNSFFEVSISLIPKPNKDIIRKENQMNIAYEYKCENSQQNTSKSDPAAYKRIMCPDEPTFIPGTQSWFNIQKSITYNIFIE